MVTGDTRRHAHRRPDGLDALVGLAAVVGVGLLVRLGLGLTFFADEWALIAERSLTLEDVNRPFNEHWFAATVLSYRLLLDVFGMGTYVPYLAVLAVLHAIVAVLVYELARRRTIPAVAASISLVVLLFGSGFENLFWGIQIGFVGSTAMGLAALLLIDDLPSLPGRGRAGAAAVLLLMAVLTSGYGLIVVSLVALDLLLDPRRRKWIGLLAIPVGAFAVWYVTLGRTAITTYGDPFTLDVLVLLPAFVFDGLATAIGSATGGGRLLGRFLVLGLAGWIALQALRGRAVPGRAVACFLAIVTEYAIVGAVRVQLTVDASMYTRYTYLAGILAMVGGASLLGQPAIPVARRPWIMAIGGLILTVSLAWNVRLLIAGRDLYAERAELTRALLALGTAKPLPPGIDPNLSLVLVPSPLELRRVIAAYGSPLADSIAGGFVTPISAAARSEALRRARNPPDWLIDAGSP